jgi:Flp pilus assembly protein TadD
MSQVRAFPSGFVMRIGIARTVLIGVAALALAGCSASGKLNNPFESKSDGTEAYAAAPANDADAPPALGVQAATEPGLLGSDPNDALSLGKKQYHANNFGLAEKYFRHAAELHPRDAEAWLGLAASYDRLRRFDLADRAYGQAIGILGPTAEIMNNQGYSYMLRGDYKRAREKLAAAQRLEPANKYVANNMQLLEDSTRKGKAIE